MIKAITKTIAIAAVFMVLLQSLLVPSYVSGAQADTYTDSGEATALGKADLTYLNVRETDNPLTVHGLIYDGTLNQFARMPADTAAAICVTIRKPFLNIPASLKRELPACVSVVAKQGGL